MPGSILARLEIILFRARRNSGLFLTKEVRSYFLGVVARVQNKSRAGLWSGFHTTKKII